MSCLFCKRTKLRSNSFFRFPKDEVTRELWIKACVAHNWKRRNVPPRSLLCSDHFTENDYEETILNQRKRLKKNSIPSCFPWLPYVHCVACNEIHKEGSGIDFHMFPTDKNLRSMWKKACEAHGINLKSINSEYSLCSKHFSADSFILPSGKIRINAVPTQFSTSGKCESASASYSEGTKSASTKNVTNVSPMDISCENGSCIIQPLHSVQVIHFRSNISSNITTLENVTNEESSQETGAKRRLDFSNQVPVESPKTRKRIKIWRPTRVGDMTEEHFNTLRKAKTNFRILAAKYKECQKTIARYRAKTWKLQKELQSYKSLLIHLSKTQLVSFELASDQSWTPAEELS